MADEIEYKFNTQLKYTQDSEPSVAKIKAIMDIIGVDYEPNTESLNQKDYYFDTTDYALLRNKNSLRIRDVKNGQTEITSKHFISLDNAGQHHRREDTEKIGKTENQLEVLTKIGEKYFPGVEIQKKPMIIVNNNRISFRIMTGLSNYQLCLDKFFFQNVNDGTKSDDLYEIEVERDSSNKKYNHEDPQLNKLSKAFKDVFDFSKTEKNKYAKGIEWLKNPINTNSMQFVLFDVVNYSLLKSIEQKIIIKNFTKIITDVLIEYSEDNCIKIPIGDGVILCFRESMDKTIKIVKKVMEKIKTNNREESGQKFELRSAIHYGLVLEYQDINNRLNLSGLGINTASRILNNSKKNQILVSDDCFKLFSELGMMSKESIKSDSFSEPFLMIAKHNVNISVRNLYFQEEDIGIPHI